MSTANDTPRMALIRARLTQALAPESLEIEDQSWMHAGHAGGAAHGGGHFAVNITSAAFAGKRLVARHRLVYDALGDAMKTEIHALAMVCRAPGEALP